MIFCSIILQQDWTSVIDILYCMDVTSKSSSHLGALCGYLLSYISVNEQKFSYISVNEQKLSYISVNKLSYL